MLKLTAYKKISLSRNILILILTICLIGVGLKITFAHQKISIYKEAVRLFNSGELISAEERYRKARMNPFVIDHNKEIDQRLSVLSPIRESMLHLDMEAKEANKESNLPSLVEIYNEYQSRKQEWQRATNIHQDMFHEMATKTKIEKDLQKYFKSFNSHLHASLQESKNQTNQQETIFGDLSLIPAEYYGGEKQKTAEIHHAFITYFQKNLDEMMNGKSFVATTKEGKRQFQFLKKFSINTDWLQKILKPYLFSEIQKTFTSEQYELFIKQAVAVKTLESYLKEAEVFSYIDRSVDKLYNKASRMVSESQFEEAIHLYEAIDPLEDTSELVASVEQEWDLHEPLRVLQRQSPGTNFQNHVSGRNNWGADSFIAAISADGIMYFGKQNRGEEMLVTSTTIGDTTSVKHIQFYNELSNNGNPVIYFESDSQSRKHYYQAYEVSDSSLIKILDIEADGLTMESDHLLLIDNPVGEGEGELAYFEPTYDGVYAFSSVQVDYVDINVADIQSYTGEKVRFNAYIESAEPGWAWVVLSQEYNSLTNEYDTEYLLLRGQFEFENGRSYTIIGTYNGEETITFSDESSSNVPVVDVIEYE
ncbi:hypothetical protein ACFSO7_23255 [Bacillus sp. CGMCC 1.16607]|uniref:hypothetical protein n=1 Tax=Bacillus sp. CGMCC 1.16607 TaxID=3351842 RepID=UPI0036402BCE